MPEELQPIIEIVERLSMPGALALVAILFFKSPLPQACADMVRKVTGNTNGSDRHGKRIDELESVVAEYTGNHYTDIQKDIKGIQEFQMNMWNRVSELHTRISVLEVLIKKERSHDE